MEQYDDTFEHVDSPPTIKEIEKRLRPGMTGASGDYMHRHTGPK